MNISTSLNAKKLVLSILTISAFSFGANAQINDLPVSTEATTLCDGQTTTITTTGSQTGVSYYLRNNINTIVDGPISGNGNDLNFNTGAINSTETFNVYAEQESLGTISFDGVDDVAYLGTSDRGVSTKVTVGCWVRTSVQGVAIQLVNKYSGSSGYILFINASGKASFDCKGLGGTYTPSGASTTTVNDGQWHYIMGTSELGGTSKIYVDGVWESGNTGPNNGSTYANPASITVGAYNTTYSMVEIDEVSIYNNVLPVSPGYTTCLVGTETNLVGYFKFDEGTGTTLVDSSPINLSGTLSGGTWVYQAPTPCQSPNDTLQMSQTVTINILNIADETISAPTSVCDGETAQVSTGSSVIGANYSLLDNLGNVIDGPISGTGNAIDFTTNPITTSSMFTVIGEGPTTPINNALRLDGVNDHISLTALNRGVTLAVTVACWVKTTTIGTVQYLISKYDGSSGYALFINTSGKASFDGKGVGGTYASSGPSTTTINDGQWHYVVGTVAAGSTWKIYVDGVWESGNTGTNGSSYASPSDLIIGAYSPSYSSIEIDEIGIWKAELSGTIILDNYSNCLTGLEPNLTGYFDLNETYGIEVIDNSPSVTNGTLINMNPIGDRVTSSASNCSSNSACRVEMTQTPTIVPTIINNTINISGGITLSSNQLGATYRWLDCDNNNVVISGEIAQNFTATTNGNYAVEITYNGCIDTSDCSNVTIVGIQKFNNIRMNISPNPTRDLLKITTADKIEQVTIYNINGSLVKTIQQNNNTINVSELSKGMYFLMVKTNNGIIQAKFVKE
tara:strand:+ start:4227 stop:6608 length:2382 start_codon:yes stop_codon:yes gene_type:complete